MKNTQYTGWAGEPYTTVADAALSYFSAGFPIIPIVPGSKKAAVKWDRWLNQLSESSIREYWGLHPDHGIGFIVQAGLVVLDADTPKAVAALYQIEEAFDISPSVIVTTRRGEHHYFQIDPLAKIKNAAFDTDKHPQCIDIKVRRSMVLLPWNDEKRFERCDIDCVQDLARIDQPFIDSIFRHNGQSPLSSVPRVRPPGEPVEHRCTTDKQLKALVTKLDADIGHDDWKQIGMALSHETRNSEDGYQIFDAWSATGAKYKGRNETRPVWRSFANEPENPITIATLIKMVNDTGADAKEIMLNNRDMFTKVPFEIVYPETASPIRPPRTSLFYPLDRFSLTGSSRELEKRRQDEVFVLLYIALLGQATVIYASPNCGKTLAVISLLTDAITDGRIKADRVYYVNADDNLAGLTEKVRIAEEFGFHMIGDGFKDFRAAMLLPILEKMIEEDKAAGAILILDTAKRFTDLMSKKEVSNFTGLVRRFVAQGGTVIALAHVNKQKSDSGKSIYAGTSDMIDDFDCAFVVELVDDGAESGRRVITFENRKARGSVARVIHFAYLSPDCVSSYQELLSSFCEVDSEDANKAASLAQKMADAPLVDLVTNAIHAGPLAKKDLIALLREHGGISRNAASSLIERYCGDDPSKHLWTFERGQRGVHRYRLIKGIAQGGEA